MITEGFFTEDEIDSARVYGAMVKPKKGGHELHFPTEEKYKEWMGEQRKSHPSRWADAIQIPVKASTR